MGFLSPLHIYNFVLLLIVELYEYERGMDLWGKGEQEILPGRAIIAHGT